MLTGSNPDTKTLPVLVAPSRSGEVNRVRATLAPKSCFSVEDSHFEFDSSFVLPLGLTFDAQPLKKAMDDHPGSKLSIFGHTDPVGKDTYNKTLSGRRAQAIFGLLVRDVELWKDLYFHHDTLGNDPWGVRSIQIMLNRVGTTKTGNVKGVLDAQTRQALKDFEEANSLPPKGFNQKQEIDPGTFEVLAKLYMDALCTDDDNNPVQLKPEDFLAGGTGNDGKGDFQGCGEFNPLMMFSKEEKALFDKEQNKDARNKENQINRRIMILLYRAGTKIDPAAWPCPTVKEGPEKCQLRFFANAKLRRSNLEQRREHKDEPTNPDIVGTFACRFYERQSSTSPCEGPPPIPQPTLEVDVVFDTGSKDEEKGDSYRLQSTDGVFVQALECSTARRVNDKQRVLTFTDVLPEKNYTLFRVLSPDVQYPVFKDVPVLVIQKNGPDTPLLALNDAPGPQPPEEPEPLSGDPDFKGLSRQQFAQVELNDLPDRPGTDIAIV